jgi:hypothetical protein
MLSRRGLLELSAAALVAEARKGMAVKAEVEVEVGVGMWMRFVYCVWLYRWKLCTSTYYLLTKTMEGAAASCGGLGKGKTRECVCGGVARLRTFSLQRRMFICIFFCPLMTPFVPVALTARCHVVRLIIMIRSGLFYPSQQLVSRGCSICTYRLSCTLKLVRIQASVQHQ